MGPVPVGAPFLQPKTRRKIICSAEKPAERPFALRFTTPAAPPLRPLPPSAEFPLPEEIVLMLSVRYFNDPEPCEIHRAAVQKRAMLELTEVCGTSGPVALEALPAEMRAYFPEGTAFVRILEDCP